MSSEQFATDVPVYGETDPPVKPKKTKSEKIKLMISILIAGLLGLAGSGLGITNFLSEDEEKPRLHVYETIPPVVDGEAPPAPAPFSPSFVDRAPKPIRLSIVCQREAVAGDLVEIHANAEYDSTDAVYCRLTYTFSIVPNIDGLKWRSDEPDAMFANRDPGEYIIFVAVSGPNGEVASAWKSITLLPNVVPVPVPVPQEVSVEEGEEAERMAEEQPPIPVVEPQKLQLADVGMTNFAAAIEALAIEVKDEKVLPNSKIVAAAFRAASTATSSNQLNGKEPFDYAVEYANTQLTDSAAAWKPFFDGVKTKLGALVELGVVGSHEDIALALADAATVLEQAGPN